MPPKPKFTKEEVISAALALIEEEGCSALTARSLGARLKSSARPVFTLFAGGMDEVLRETEHAARAKYNEYVAKGLAEELAFKGVGMAYIRFAKEHAQLFEWLFMRRRNMELSTALITLDENYSKILASVHRTFGKYGTTAKEEEDIYLHLWIYSHGIASLCATGACALSEEQISKMLTEVAAGLVQKIAGEKRK